MRIFQQEFSQPLVLELGLLDIVSDWQGVNPVGGKLLGHLRILSDVGLLKLKDFTNTSNCVISSMVKLCRLRFLFVYLSRHLKFCCVFQSLKAVFSLSGKGVSSMSSDYADSVCCSLSKTSTLVCSKTAYCLNDYCVVSGCKVVRSQMFNHVVEYKKTELLSLLNITGESFVERSRA